ncbi:hypothetical protein J6590_084341, partial [Homalodisca vitripennis]
NPIATTVAKPVGACLVLSRITNEPGFLFPVHNNLLSVASSYRILLHSNEGKLVAKHRIYAFLYLQSLKICVLYLNELSPR